MKEITFVRHAESADNRAGVWNGRSDGALSPEGEAQIEALSRRAGGKGFDRVFTSPLLRARATAEALGEAIVEDDLIEIDLGEWDGLTTEQVRERDEEALQEAIRDRVAPMGRTGESIDEAGERFLNAIDKLVATMPEDSSAAVVTHGGLLQTMLHRYLPGHRHRAHAFADNSSLTRVMYFDDHSRLASFNDTGHLGPRSVQVALALEAGQPVVTLIRHGQTQANVERRWQGQTDWDLDEVGHRQAESLGAFYGRWGTVFSSPLLRARSTAGYVASGEAVFVDEFMEMHMGEWEGLTTEEIEAQWPSVLEQIYHHGQDLKRGSTGESWAELTTRFRGAVEALDHAAEEPTLVVAHGGAIRSYVSSLTATKDTYAESLFTPPNTSVTHVAVTERGPLLLDYAVASHLDDLEP